MPPLVGRDLELATIDRFLRSVPEGFRAVVLRGGAGYGKSALLDETVTRAHAAGFRVLTARPAQTEAELPFGVLAELLEPVELSGLDLPGPQERALDVALRRLDPDEAHPVDPLGLSLAVIAALRELAAERPLLVALDDVQWCDPPSLRTLGFALRRVDTERVGLAVGLRTGDGSDTAIRGSTGGVVYVDVGPLDEAAFGVAVRRDAGANLPRPVIRHLHVACDGNPLFGKEVAALLADRAVSDDPAAPVPVPPSAAETIGRRVGKLGLRTRDVLLAAAALPRPTVEVLLAAFPEEEVDGALARSAAAGIVAVDGGQVRFTHPLVAAAGELATWLGVGHAVGLHSATHPDCSRRDADGVRVEILAPARRLCTDLGQASVAFSYPFGRRCGPAQSLGELSAGFWRVGISAPRTRRPPAAGLPLSSSPPIGSKRR